MEVAFQSELSPLMRNQLEAVFFFNPKQSHWVPEIQAVVAQHGVPEIVESGGKLTIALRGNTQTQTLFAVNPQPPGLLEGVIIYSRITHSEILVLHLALAGRRLESGFAVLETSSTPDFLRVMTAFTKVAKSIAGVERVRFAYWNLAIPVV
jgi:hypothetical protein